MKNTLEEDPLLKRFLLGEMSEGERGAVEERLFDDPEYFRQFRAAEDELTDEYLYGDLDADGRERFERYFLNTPERRESLRVSKALKQYISRNADAAVIAGTATRADAVPVLRPEKKSFFDFLRLPALRFSLAAAAVLIVAVGIWLLTSPRGRPDPTLQANTADTRPSPREVARATPEQNNREQIVRPTPAGNANGDTAKDGGVRTPKPPRQTHPRVYSFLILPLGQVRDDGGGQQNEVNLPADAGVVKLRIPLMANPGRRRYRVTLQTDAGRNIKSWTNLKPAKGKAGRTVNVNVPASTLTQQKYRLELAAATGVTISTFHFKVTR
jgi:anti-sigma factor RsiW